MSDVAFNDELARRIMGETRFDDDFNTLLHVANAGSLGLPSSPVSEDVVRRLLQAAAALSSSSNTDHQQVANDISTALSKLEHAYSDAAVRVARLVLSRLRLFPSSDLLPGAAPLPELLEVEAAWHRRSAQLSVGNSTFLLSEFQQRIWTSLQTENSVIVGAPTSAGKSFILKLFLANYVVQHRGWCVFLGPTRALIRQVANDLSALFIELGLEDAQVRTTGHGAEPDGFGVFALTQERLAGLLEQPGSPQVQVLVVDEATGLGGEDGRAVLLWEVVDELRRRAPTCKVVMAGAVSGTARSVGKLLGPGVPAVDGLLRPVRTAEFRVSYTRAGAGSVQARTGGPQAFQLPKGMRQKRDRLVGTAVRFGGGGQSLVYAPTPSRAQKLAVRLGEVTAEQAPSPQARARRAELADFIRVEVHPKFSLAGCVERGVAFHYGRMPGVIRSAVEDAFAVGDLGYIVCTSTLLQGVNLPARNIFVGSSMKGRTRKLDAHELRNLTGRAGRLGKDLVGNVFLVEPENWRDDPSLEAPSAPPSSFAELVRTQPGELLKCLDPAEPSRASERVQAAAASLFLAQREGRFDSLWEKVSPALASGEHRELARRVEEVARDADMPTDVVRANRAISPLAQNDVWHRMGRRLDGDGNSEGVMPIHPAAEGSYERLSVVFRFVDLMFEGVDNSRHRYFSLQALRWMRGESLSKMIRAEMAYKNMPESSADKAATSMFATIETEIRFRYSKYVKCYVDMLKAQCERRGWHAAIARVPSIPLYLELGACTETAISFVGLGLTRATAHALARVAPPNLSSEQVGPWVRKQKLSGLELPPVCLREVMRLVGRATTR